MAGPKPALYAAGVTSLGFLCLALSSTAVGLPIWGYYDNPSSGWESERGYFGPWKVCKQLNYGREICGQNNRFKPSAGIYVSGILAAISSTCLGVFCILSILQIAMISSRDKIVMQYKPLVLLKLLLAIAAALLAISAAVLFGIEIDRTDRSFSVSRGISFYIQIIVIILTIGLFFMALYDVFFSRRVGNDPTIPIEISAAPATTYNNPGFREGRRTTNGTSSTTVAVTDTSGKPYVYSQTGGSVASMNTTLTSVSNGSTLGSTVDGSITRSPLRSSLKKPKPKDPTGGLGIQNRGYSGSSQSPTMQRNGSVKKVRIQTHSTEV